MLNCSSPLFPVIHIIYYPIRSLAPEVFKNLRYILVMCVCVRVRACAGVCVFVCEFRRKTTYVLKQDIHFLDKLGVSREGHLLSIYPVSQICRGARTILDLYIPVYIGPPRFFCLAIMCRLVWPTGAYTATPLVDWPSENGGQYAQAKTVGIIRFVTSLFYFYPDFKWVSASNYRYCINEICLSDGCRSTLPVVKLRKVRLRKMPENNIRKLGIWLYRYWTYIGDVYWTGGSIFITGGPI